MYTVKEVTVATFKYLPAPREETIAEFTVGIAREIENKRGAVTNQEVISVLKQLAAEGLVKLSKYSNTGPAEQYSNQDDTFFTHGAFRVAMVEILVP